MSLRPKVVALYKQLQYLAREYPYKPQELSRKIHDAFMKNRDETDPRKIKQLLAQGRYMVKELEALYALKKYRFMKKSYYD